MMDPTDYSIFLSEVNARNRMELFDKRALKAKTHKTMHKNFRISDCLYAEYRELIEDEPNYVTFTLPLLEGILDD
ncbi:MAG: hypothetical protein ACO3DK_08675, partial [Bacteroidia bacterium]